MMPYFFLIASSFKQVWTWFKKLEKSHRAVLDSFWILFLEKIHYKIKMNIYLNDYYISLRYKYNTI